jgi:choline-glycine betaine transporter
MMVGNTHKITKEIAQNYGDSLNNFFETPTKYAANTKNRHEIQWTNVCNDNTLLILPSHPK